MELVVSTTIVVELLLPSLLPLLLPLDSVVSGGRLVLSDPPVELLPSLLLSLALSVALALLLLGDVLPVLDDVSVVLLSVASVPELPGESSPHPITNTLHNPKVQLRMVATVAPRGRDDHGPVAIEEPAADAADFRHAKSPRVASRISEDSPTNPAKTRR